MKKINVSTPGRICLFGEHQDYLGLPVIAAAISRYLTIEGKYTNDLSVNIDLPDINSSESFPIGENGYGKERDYFKSVLNVMIRDGFTFSKGIEALVLGSIPINAGASSSTALIVSWVALLAKLSDQEVSLPLSEIARIAWEAEVAEFNEPGGKMDHYSTTYGGLLFIEFKPEFRIRRIKTPLSTFVMGNSNQPKDTKAILARVKNGVLNIVEKLQKQDNTFSLKTIRMEELKNYKSYLSEEEQVLLTGTIENRDITYKALELLSSSDFEDKKLGYLLNQHQNILRDVLKISTSKIDDMLKAALDAGALGGKINGSGGGGTMFVYAPENPEKVFEAVNRIADSYLVKITGGVKIVSESIV